MTESLSSLGRALIESLFSSVKRKLSARLRFSGGLETAS
jgi:hypothetical protein